MVQWCEASNEMGEKKQGKRDRTTLKIYSIEDIVSGNYLEPFNVFTRIHNELVPLNRVKDYTALCASS